MLYSQKDVGAALAYHQQLWKNITSPIIGPSEEPSFGHSQQPTIELLVAIVEATFDLKRAPGHDQIYCLAQRDWELRWTDPAGLGYQRFPQWHSEVVRFPLYEEESRGQRTILGNRVLFLSCGSKAGGFLGMTCIQLTGVFRRNTQTLDGWYTLRDATGVRGEIHLELSIADRPKRMRSFPAFPPVIVTSPSGEDTNINSPSRRSTISVSNELSLTSNSRYPRDPREPFFPDLAAPLPDLTGQVCTAQKFSTAGGGYSDVWRGHWENKSLTVAIKRLRTPMNAISLTKLEKRLKREVRIWRKLDHKNVAPLYGLASDFGPISAMVCKWYDKGNLVQYLQLCGPDYPVHGRLRLLIDVATGLCYLHGLNIIHGDLKGANVLIDDEGNASLCDFGLSSIVADNDSQYFTSTIGATIRWAAPEVHRVQSPSTPPEITPASDIYSFGGVMLEVFSGRFPYYDVKNDVLVMAELVVGRKPPRPPEPPIAEEHWRFMMLCWADDMVNRPDIVVVLDQLLQFHRLISR